MPVRARIERPFGADPTDLPPAEPAPATRVVDAAGVTLTTIDLRVRRDRRRFLAAADPIYRGDPAYVAPLRIERMWFLDPDRNAGLRDIGIHAIIAARDSQTVGRITAHIDRAYDRYHGTRMGWFGFFECIDDRGVAHLLLGEAVRWLRAAGAREILGPASFNTNHQCGLLVENFTRSPAFDMPYNPPYYEDLVTSFGFGKAKDLYAWWIDVRTPLENAKIARIARLAERVRRREGVTIRHVVKRRFKQECDILFGMFNPAWRENWGYVPMTRAVFDHVAKSMKPILREEVILIVEVAGRPAGFALTLPDVNQIVPRNGSLLPFGWLKLLLGLRRIRRGRLVLLGVLPEFRRRGLESLLFVETALRCREIGLVEGEISWTLEDNWLVNRALESMDCTLDRRYRLYGLRLPD